MIAYTFIQSVASDTWTIVHNLGHKPVSDISVYQDGNLEKIIPKSVVHLDDNTLEVKFSISRTGVAQLM